MARRDQDLQQARLNFAAVERARRETRLVSESGSRRLRAEKARGMAAEQRLEPLAREPEAVAHQSQVATH